MKSGKGWNRNAIVNLERWLLDTNNFDSDRRLVMDQMENKWGLNGEKLKDLTEEWF